MHEREGGVGNGSHAELRSLNLVLNAISESSLGWQRGAWFREG